HSRITPTPPPPLSPYTTLFRSDVLRLDFASGNVVRALGKIAWWLSGPSELYVLVPLHAAAVAMLVRVGLFGARFDPWLRLVALADRKSTRLNSSHVAISYAVFC